MLPYQEVEIGKIMFWFSRWV